MALDYLQFPAQSLTYKAGDCDDLSILNSALLESIGIETAFITFPGHIYLAFALDMDPEDAKKTFRSSDDLIFKDNNTWVPLEITEVQKGFLRAWQIGAKQWREYEAAGTVGFYPIRQAWESFEPVGISIGDSGIDLPPANRVTSAYMDALNRFIQREIQDKVRSLTENLASGSDRIRAWNKLGVLYARYGLYDEAEEQFLKVVWEREYVPALINLGNIFYIREELEEALEFYERANRAAPKNATALLGIARVNYELENYGAVNAAYSSAEQINPEMAAKFSYLVTGSDSTGRAAAAEREVTLWEEE
jgi:lipopolysaccharide biosynthesis regulator YciM